MPVPEPAWKVRRRPCPFYWQGKCLFADSCNFLHSVNAPAPVIVVNNASPESAPSQPRSSVDSVRGFDDDDDEHDDEHEELADDELDSSSEQSTNEDDTIHASRSSSWAHEAQGMSTPPRPSAGNELHAAPHLDNGHTVPQHTHTPPQSDTHSLDSDDESLLAGSSSSSAHAAIGLGLILTPISPPRASRYSFARTPPAQDTVPDFDARDRSDSLALSSTSEQEGLACIPRGHSQYGASLSIDSQDVLHRQSDTSQPVARPTSSTERQALEREVTRRDNATTPHPTPLTQQFARPAAARRVNARLRSVKATPEFPEDVPTYHRRDDGAAAYQTPVSPPSVARPPSPFRISGISSPHLHDAAAFVSFASGTSDRERKLRELADRALGEVNALHGGPARSVTAPEPERPRRPRIARPLSIDYTTEPESVVSGSSKSSHSTAPTWLKPLRLGTLSGHSEDTESVGRVSRPTSMYSTVSVHVPSTISSRSSTVALSHSTSRPPSRSPSVLRLDTAIAASLPLSRRNSIVPYTTSPSPSPTPDQQFRMAQSAPPAPLLPPAQIFTSASRSLSPPCNQPMFKLSDKTTPSPGHAVFSPTPTIYSPLSMSSDKAASSLFFAIASDDKAQVTQSLKDLGHPASPNMRIGPEEVPALLFAITNDQLSNKLPIVKTLLEHGADPTVVYDNRSKGAAQQLLTPQVEDNATPAMEYYLQRAAAMAKDPTIEALKKSELGSITATNFRLVGQDHMLRHLYRALRLYISGAVSTPFVTILAGPSGLGKSHIAKQFNDILSLPAHIINLSSLRSQSSLLGMKPALADLAGSDPVTLQDFLAAHEGQRCVVVLEDIEKVEDRNALHSLIVPFELGRFLLGTGYVDTSKVLWFATSSLGTASVMELYSNERVITDDEYRQMMAKARSELSAALGASLVSRVGSVLPFVPFTDAEKSVIVCEAASALLARVGDSYAPEKMDHLVRKIVGEHRDIDGRGLLRAVAEQF